VKSRLLTYVALFYVVFCWGLNTVLIKHALTEIDPLAFMSLRFAIMTPLALVLLRLSGEKLHVEKGDWPLLIGCGACGYGIYQYLWVLGLAHTSPFASALLGSFAPIFTLAILAVAGHERVRTGRWFGAAIALAGVAIFEGVFAGRATFQVGDALTFAAALVFAGYNVMSARLLDRYTPLNLLAITMAIGTVMIVPSGIGAIAHENFASVSPGSWGAFAFAVFFPIMLTYPVWSWGINRIGAARVSLFSFLTPVIAGTLSLPILHARFDGHQILGAAVCLAGMVVSNLLGKTSLAALWSWRAFGVER
jgi:drug/metabolite transporter (DMT)-like permease